LKKTNCRTKVRPYKLSKSPSKGAYRGFFKKKPVKKAFKTLKFTIDFKPNIKKACFKKTKRK